MALHVKQREWDDGIADDLPELRWFALSSAVTKLQAECAVLLEASKLADTAWRRACLQLAEFESLRDALSGSGREANS